MRSFISALGELADPRPASKGFAYFLSPPDGSLFKMMTFSSNGLFLKHYFSSSPGGLIYISV